MIHLIDSNSLIYLSSIRSEDGRLSPIATIDGNRVMHQNNEVYAVDTIGGELFVVPLNLDLKGRIYKGSNFRKKLPTSARKRKNILNILNEPENLFGTSEFYATLRRSLIFSINQFLNLHQILEMLLEYYITQIYSQIFQATL